ncbi:MAG: hypothetical protein A2268_03580 [Candidatus Raymondbacteria bacterium RifOxyA12_full_50_37]|uniref:Pyruvate/ketoisovalerate oxidoreductase catalytic domain-containing protein n=1 Tax=Candidatus Raymondbacteria bacterium RIFOXYD12_FULL_49_13 TaxID=1817890 RepID=A0A1F7F4T0_UNCRA|nr:MAG: hypothetical protein A2268_03580 [Candidatus Raymondbacteria bacterium RifOxyA12_full_50_37]OGJ91875.1 MAG: hypothetical protein A2248_04650 [Candidatus Raymondbacteria bacterium RIFOXYA2_FULL_49_16]OGJ98087.1 MAG: hypothetical protein A2453_12365 [Candidatus Raymondbacteria bacterium RIFOXYC2_FULL_50_21]OGJ98098.1 MAG: hypothetical protein A2487_03920 [Candidatus Raymondbacteria bacterium RifOxyC12_full_50_8]OGK01675.1 MAG: hypothetical protein A2519_09095 [Candidatus Raymondbacteria b
MIPPHTLPARIIISGLGGQGVILAGCILGRAAALYERTAATLTRSFGPAARGSACSAQLILDDTLVHYPYVDKPQVLLALSQQAFEQYAPLLVPGGVLIIDEHLVKPPAALSGISLYAVPATRYAEVLGNRQVANSIVVGFFVAVTGLFARASVERALRESVPPGTMGLNLKAFSCGYSHAIKMYGEHHTFSGRFEGKARAVQGNKQFKNA